MADSIISATATSTAAEGGYAVANYSITGALGIATTVKVTVSGLGGATSLDYSGFQYSMGDLIGDWQTATSGGLITLNAGFTNFQLRVLVNNDTLSEAGEALAFSVAQTTSSVGLADSWWVPSTVNLVDPAGQGASALLRAITASATPTTTAVEAIGTATNINHAAVATFDLSGGGTTTAGSYGSTVVHVGVNGQGGATSLDYSGFSYHMGTSGSTGSWTAVPTDGLITIGSSDLNFQLSANVLYDSLTEASESLSFTVAQTTNSTGLTDSWWVPSTVNLSDNPAALLRAITASATTTAVEASGTATNINHAAVATFDLSGGGTTTAGSYGSTVVHVGVNGQGGATSLDYSGFSYHMGTSGSTGSWTAVPTDGLITIGSSDLNFQLSANVSYDILTEASESLSFTVAQTTNSIGLTDSWWVPSTVNLADPAGQGASALLRAITASATPTTTAVEASGTAANINHAAVATFDLSGGGTTTAGSYGSTVVHVGVNGQGGATSLDYSGFSYHMGTSGSTGGWTAVPTDGLITIGSSDLNFQLSANVSYDILTEASESLSFTVAQTTNSNGLTDSWWVPSTVNLADPAGQGASALLRAITASATPTTTAVEASSLGNIPNNAAVATFDLSGGGTTTAGSYGSTVVHVGVNGQGGATSLDYSGFSYHMGTSGSTGSWTAVPTNGLITIGSSDLNFQLSANVLYDSLTEASESLSFTVAQTTNSNGLTDSWSVQSTVDLADADPAHNVYTGAMGRDHFVATGAAEIFVIPANTSVIDNNAGATGVFAGDIVNFFGTDYDTIADFINGSDKIDLPSGVSVTSVTSGTVWGGTEETLLDWFTLPTKVNFASFFGAPEAGSDAKVYQLGATSTYFLFVDSNNNENWDPTTDVFIKFVGNPSLTPTDFM